jgi:hypothetical protein
MTDLINKKLTFPQSQITIKIIEIINTGQTNIYSCVDYNNNTIQYCLKIMQSRSDDRINSGIINTEIILLVKLILNYLKDELKAIIKYYQYDRLYYRGKIKCNIIFRLIRILF